jgi:hypothetical protein
MSWMFDRNEWDDPETDDAWATSAARWLAEQVAGVEFTELRTVTGISGSRRQALFERAGVRYALVPAPAGGVRLGFDPARLALTAEEAASYAGSVEEFGFDPDPAAHVARVTGPARTVRVPSLLVGVEPAVFEDTAPGDVPAALAEIGARLPTPDEWEYACGGGAPTLFHWGDHPPGDVTSYEAKDGPHLRPNLFGLSVAHDTYRPEITSDPAVAVGGDGGEAACGGYGAFLSWLPLATAYRDPGLPEMLQSPEWDDYFDEIRARPVIDLPI